MATASSNSLQVLWWPGTMRCDLFRNDSKSSKSEFVFDFKKIKELKKKDAKGNFHIKYSSARSFTFWVEAGQKPLLKCKVRNVPEDMDTSKPPAYKLADGSIQVTIKKTTKNNWVPMLGPDLPFEYPDLVDIE